MAVQTSRTIGKALTNLHSESIIHRHGQTSGESLVRLPPRLKYGVVSGKYKQLVHCFDRLVLAASERPPGSITNGGYSHRQPLRFDVSAETSLTDRFTFDCGLPQGTAKINFS